MAPLGNIAPCHPFLSPGGEERGRVGIHGRAGEQAQATEQLRSKFVVGRFEAPPLPRAKAQQESPQRVLMREISETQQGGISPFEVWERLVTCGHPCG